MLMKSCSFAWYYIPTYYISIVISATSQPQTYMGGYRGILYSDFAIASRPIGSNIILIIIKSQYLPIIRV